jgi:uncharacterized protein (TIGR02001 family)
MLKNKLLVAALASVFSMSAFAEDAPASPHTITSNVALVSDYVYNGISQTYGQPAIQGGFDYSHSSGIYLGTWASNVSGNQYFDASMEFDVYGGYNGKVNDDLTYNAGLIEVLYPNSKATNALFNSGTSSPRKKFDTTQFTLGATWKGLNIKLTQTLTDWYGIDSDGFTPAMWNPSDTLASGATGGSTADFVGADSKGSQYVEVNYSLEVADKLTVLAHAGHQKIKNFSLLSYSDYKLGITKDVGGYVFGAAYTNTNVTDNTLYNATNVFNDQKKKLSDGRLVFSLTHSL